MTPYDAWKTRDRDDAIPTTYCSRCGKPLYSALDYITDVCGDNWCDNCIEFLDDEEQELYTDRSLVKEVNFNW